VEAMLVGDRDELAHRALRAAQCRHGAARVPRDVDVERRPPGVIRQRRPAAAHVARDEASRPAENAWAELGRVPRREERLRLRGDQAMHPDPAGLRRALDPGQLRQRDGDDVARLPVVDDPDGIAARNGGELEDAEDLAPLEVRDQRLERRLCRPVGTRGPPERIGEAEVQARLQRRGEGLRADHAVDCELLLLLEDLGRLLGEWTEHAVDRAVEQLLSEEEMLPATHVLAFTTSAQNLHDDSSFLGATPTRLATSYG